MKLSIKPKEDAMADKIQIPTPVTDESALARFCNEVSDELYRLGNKKKQTLSSIEIKDTDSEEIREVKTKINEIVTLLNS